MLDKFTIALTRITRSTEFQIIRVGCIPRAMSYKFVRMYGDVRRDGWQVRDIDQATQETAANVLQRSLTSLGVENFTKREDSGLLDSLVVFTPPGIRYVHVDLAVERFALSLLRGNVDIRLVVPTYA